MELAVFYQIIDEYDNQTFEACRDTLYDALNYQVLKKEDIRRIDLKEKLAVFFQHNQACSNAKEHFEQPLASYIERAINEHLIFSDNRTKKYYGLAQKYISMLKNGTADLTTIENLIVIYISSFREYKRKNRGKKIEGKEKLGQTDFYLNRESINVATFIYSEIRICGKRIHRRGLKRIEEA